MSLGTVWQLWWWLGGRESLSLATPETRLELPTEMDDCDSNPNSVTLWTPSHTKYRPTAPSPFVFLQYYLSGQPNVPNSGIPADRALPSGLESHQSGEPMNDRR